MEVGQVHEQHEQEVKKLVENVAKALVETPELVHVETVAVNQMTTVFTIYSGPNEARFVIGRYGRLINAVRLLVSAVGSKHNRIYRVEVVDSEANGDTRPVGGRG